MPKQRPIPKRQEHRKVRAVRRRDEHRLFSREGDCRHSQTCLTERAQKYESRKSKAVERTAQSNILGETSVAAMLGFWVGGPVGAVGAGLMTGLVALMSQDHNKIADDLEREGAIVYPSCHY